MCEHTNCVVKRFDTVCICIAVVLPRFSGKQSVVRVVCEQIVQTIHKRHAVVVENGSDQIVLAVSTSGPACWIALRLVPFGELQPCQHWFKGP